MAALYSLAFLRDAFTTSPAASPAPVTTVAPPRASAIEGLEARRELTSLRVAPAGSLDGFSEDAYGGWDRYGDCDTRAVVLRGAGTGGIVDLGHCHLAGTWRSSYDGRTTSNLDSLTVDHLVGLGQAWQSGASAWTPQQRHRYATDLGGLVVVTASVAAGKPTSSDPSTWRPPDRADWCRFGVDWIKTKDFWDLTVTAAERDALGGMLATCPQG